MTCRGLDHLVRKRSSILHQPVSNRTVCGFLGFMLVFVMILLVRMWLARLGVPAIWLEVILIALWAGFGLAIGRLVDFGNVAAPREPLPRNDLWLAARRCPACGYDLRGVRADDGGYRVCPECGAAWRDVRVGAPVEHATGSGWITDAEGRPVAILEPFLEPEDAAHARDHAAFARHLRPRHAVGRGLHIVTAIGLLVLASVAVVVSIRFLGAAAWMFKNGHGKWAVMSGGIIVFLLFGAALLGRRAWRLATARAGLRPEAIRDAWLAEGRCPSCAARLPAADEVATTTCQACDATWTLPTDRTPAPA